MQCTLSTLSNYLIPGFELLTQFLPLLHDQPRDQVQCVTTPNQDGFSRRSWPLSAFQQTQNALKLIFGNEFATWILVLANSQQKISFSTAALNQKSHKMTKGNCLLSNLKEEKIVQTQDLKFSNNLALQARCWFGFEPFEASLDLLMY